MTELRKQMEERRIAAIPLIQQGSTLKKIAKTLRVSKPTAFRWRKAFWEKSGDPSALKSRPSSGRPKKLNEAQMARLKGMLLNEPSRPHRAMSKVLMKEFGVTYGREYIGNLAREMGLPPRQVKKKKEKKS
jgi:transposase